jgi:hypothetical protein
MMGIYTLCNKSCPLSHRFFPVLETLRDLLMAVLVFSGIFLQKKLFENSGCVIHCSCYFGIIDEFFTVKKTLVIRTARSVQ